MERKTMDAGLIRGGKARQADNLGGQAGRLAVTRIVTIDSFGAWHRHDVKFASPRARNFPG